MVKKTIKQGDCVIEFEGGENKNMDGFKGKIKLSGNCEKVLGNVHGNLKDFKFS